MSTDISNSQHSNEPPQNVEENLEISSESDKSTRSKAFFGKRFARRAKRWAEIQQRRQSTASDPTDSPSPEFEPEKLPRQEKYQKNYKVQKQYHPRNFVYNSSTFSPQDYFIQYPLPKGYIFYNPHLQWGDLYYGQSQLIHGLSNLNFAPQEQEYIGHDSPNSLSSTSSLSTSYSSQYSFDNEHSTASEQGVNNFQISAETRKLCSELFLVPESKRSENF